MCLYAFHAPSERADMVALDPFDDAAGTKVEFPYLIYLIQHPQGNALFDAVGHPDLALER
jgi:hypothetical protein